MIEVPWYLGMSSEIAFLSNALGEKQYPLIYCCFPEATFWEHEY